MFYIQDGHHQGHGQHRNAEDGQGYSHPVPPQAVVSCRYGALRKGHRHHARVMHSTDCSGHRQGRHKLDRQGAGSVHALQFPAEGKCGSRSHNGNRDRNQQKYGVKRRRRRHPHGVHAQVVHHYDTAGHGQGRTDEQRDSQLFAPDDVQSHTGSEHGCEPGNQGHDHIKRHGNTHRHSPHSNEMHRPDSGAHQQGAGQ